MRYPEEVYRPEGRGGAAPAAEAELSREERRARRGAKKRTAKKHRTQKVLGISVWAIAGATLRLQDMRGLGFAHQHHTLRYACGLWDRISRAAVRRCEVTAAVHRVLFRLYQNLHMVGKAGQCDVQDHLHRPLALHARPRSCSCSR